MAKKATTIALVIVVVFLLASTIYVSIILTSEEQSPTRPRSSQASEIEGVEPIEEDLQQGDENPPIPTVDQPPFGSNGNSLNDGGSEAPLADEAGGASDGELHDMPGTRVPQESGGEDSGLLAYANPTPTDAVLASAGTDIPGTGEGVSPSPSPNPSPTSFVEELPQTGKGQQGVIATATPTSAPQPTQPPRALPVAGGITTAVVSVIIAGTTIITALFL